MEGCGCTWVGFIVWRLAHRCVSCARARGAARRHTARAGRPRRPSPPAPGAMEFVARGEARVRVRGRAEAAGGDGARAPLPIARAIFSSAFAVRWLCSPPAAATRVPGAADAVDAAGRARCVPARQGAPRARCVLPAPTAVAPCADLAATRSRGCDPPRVRRRRNFFPTPRPPPLLPPPAACPRIRRFPAPSARDADRDTWAAGGR